MNTGKPVTPLVAVDLIISMTDRPAQLIVLIERRNPPPGWALPGGFVDVGETLEQAAVREALEETGLQVELTGLLGCYSDPERDPRGHTVSIVFTAQATGEPCAGDDAARVALYDPRRPPALAFDHRRIIQDFLQGSPVKSL